MPRNVVTVRVRAYRLPTRRNRDTQRRVEEGLVDRFRARVKQASTLQLEMDFPRRASRREAKEAVEAALDEIDARWRGVFMLYPTEASLRERGE